MAEDQAHGFARRVRNILAPVIDGPAAQIAAARVEALVTSTDHAHRARQGAYRELLVHALQELAARHQGERAATYRALAETVSEPLGHAELASLTTFLSAETQPQQTPLLGPWRSKTAAASPHAGAPSAKPGASLEDSPAGGEQAAQGRQEIDAVRERLRNEAEETIQANERAGSLLESLITRLQLGSSLPEVIGDDDTLTEEIRHIAEAHDTVAEKLGNTFESLQLLAADNQRLHDELQRVRVQSLTDESTGLPNRRAFFRQLNEESARVERGSGVFSVVVLDLDHFKAINDEHGHGAGDEVLRSYARDVLSIFRAHDLVCRYGGEEFAVLLPATRMDDAVKAMTKIQHRVRNAAVRWHGKEIPLPTFSAGIAEYRQGEQTDALIHRADRALYMAKRNGRDRIEPDGVGSSGQPAERRGAAT